MMPSASHLRWASSSDNASDSGYSDGSDRSDYSEDSQSTAPTIESERFSLKTHYVTTQLRRGSSWCGLGGDGSEDPHSSTILSVGELDEELPPFDVPNDQPEIPANTVIPSTSSEFAEFFPSTRRLHIRHDDSSLDGNMNLRVDTEVHTSEGRLVDLTLFHLRMHNLKQRDFSLRRHCRESGREICHSSRKYVKPSSICRPGLQRSVSSALSNLRIKSPSKGMNRSALKRQDSGYDSTSDEDDEPEVANQSSKHRSSSPMPTNITHLEFSNYANVDVKRRGTKTSKRYEFEYWGTKYTWKRVVRKDGSVKETSYHLTDAASSHSIAHIVPATLTTLESQEEEAKGGWVPPCSLWISDDGVVQGRTDVAE